MLWKKKLTEGILSVDNWESQDVVINGYSSTATEILKHLSMH
jgi:hypothetical protein